MLSLNVLSRLWWLPLTAIGLLRDRGSRGRWLCVPGFIAVTALVSTTGKVTIRRPRPPVGQVYPPIGRLGLASSFPSTHAACQALGEDLVPSVSSARLITGAQGAAQRTG
jgi:hypothetical protein